MDGNIDLLYWVGIKSFSSRILDSLCRSWTFSSGGWPRVGVDILIYLRESTGWRRRGNLGGKFNCESFIIRLDELFFFSFAAAAHPVCCLHGQTRKWLPKKHRRVLKRCKSTWIQLNTYSTCSYQWFIICVFALAALLSYTKHTSWMMMKS